MRDYQRKIQKFLKKKIFSLFLLIRDGIMWHIVYKQTDCFLLLFLKFFCRLFRQLHLLQELCQNAQFSYTYFSVVVFRKKPFLNRKYLKQNLENQLLNKKVMVHNPSLIYDLKKYSI